MGSATPAGSKCFPLFKVFPGVLGENTRENFIDIGFEVRVYVLGSKLNHDSLTLEWY